MPTEEQLDQGLLAELEHPWLRSDDSQFIGMGRGVSPPTQHRVRQFTGKKMGTMYVDPETKEIIIVRNDEK